LLLAHVWLHLPLARGRLLNFGIKPVDCGPGCARAGMGMGDLAVLGVQEELQQRMAVRSAGPASILGGNEQDPDERQDPERRDPARKSGFNPPESHLFHHQ